MDIFCLKGKPQVALTERLYRDVFSEDSNEFVQYYYEEKAKDNVVFVSLVEDEIVAMVHCNPFYFYMNGKKVRAHYLVAVATEPAFRHRGHMAALLRMTIRFLSEIGEPFVFLMPVDSKIYEPFHFHFIYNRKRITLVENTLAQTEMYDSIDGNSLSRLMNEKLRQDEALFVWRDLPYFDRLQKELQAQGGNIYVQKNKETKEISGYYAIGEGGEIQEAFTFDDQIDSIRYGEEKPYMMGRINDVREIGYFYPMNANCKKKIEIRLQLEDALCFSNNGQFLWTIKGKKSKLMPVPSKRQKNLLDIPLLTTSVDKLSAFLFGYETPENIFTNSSKKVIDILKQIPVMNGVFINEIV